MLGGDYGIGIDWASDRTSTLLVALTRLHEVPVVPVTVLIPCYNHGATLERAVVSCFRQPFPPQVCILNDGSTDTTLEAATRAYKQFQPHVRVVNLDHHGLSSTLNVGLEHARGEWIQRLDADDELAVGWLEHAGPWLHDEETDIIHGQLLPEGTWGPPTWTPEGIWQQNMLPYCTMFRRDAARAVGGFAGGVEEQLGVQDWGLWMKMAAHNQIGDVRRLDVPHLVYHTDQGNQLSHAGFLRHPDLLRRWHVEQVEQYQRQLAED